MRATRTRVGAALAGLAVAAGALAAAGPAAATTTAATGRMVPAIGVHPDYIVAGQVTGDPDDVTFSCQVSTPAECYGPQQIRAAYGVDKLAAQYGADGAGRTIVIIDAFSSPTVVHDLQTFDSLFGLPDPHFTQIAPDGLTPFDPADANQVGWAGEITLDVEWAHAIAPKANITLVLAKSNNDADILSATRYAVEHHLGQIISQSFGEAEQCMARDLMRQQHALFAQAVRQGITLFASAGDEGSAQPTCDNSSFFKAASTPATDPNVTAVGGTRLFADGITGAYDHESVWNEPIYAAAGGGGYSVFYGTPAYQRPLHLAARGVPDISYSAAVSGGVLVVWSSSGQGQDLVFRFAGTSAGSPQWAGLIALADQIGATHTLGAINDDLYRLARGSKYTDRFHDVTQGDNTFHGEDLTVAGFPATPGWDAATGLGTPRADVLIPKLVHAKR